MSAEAWFWAVLIAGMLALLSFQFTSHAYSDFDFGTGLVRCGVSSLSTTCGSVTQ